MGFVLGAPKRKAAGSTVWTLPNGGEVTVSWYTATKTERAAILRLLAETREGDPSPLEVEARAGVALVDVAMLVLADVTPIHTRDGDEVKWSSLSEEDKRSGVVEYIPISTLKEVQDGALKPYKKVGNESGDTTDSGEDSSGVSAPSVEDDSKTTSATESKGGATPPP